MVDQTLQEIAEVQSKNKAKEIYKDSNGLDNISEHLMNQFRQIMLEGRQ